jgi:aldose 1-epimerase
LLNYKYRRKNKMVNVTNFGKLSDGRQVKKYTITNKYGEYVELVELGAVLHSVCTFDKNGKLGDCVLGCADVEAMLGRSFKGATMGRCANRIEYARCTVEGKEYKLEEGRGGHFLHSGSGNFAFKLFESKVEDDNKTVTFYIRDHGEGGFNTDVDVYIHFTFDDDHRLTIHYELTPIDEPAVLSPTNHAYFNLNDFGDAREQILTIYASNLAKSGESGCPVGGLTPVKGTPVDFTSPRNIGEAMDSDPSFFPDGRIGYDNFYVLDRQRDDNLAAVLYAPKTGRVMKAYTDMQSVILYTPSECAGRDDKNGTLTADYSAVCIETQFVPNAVNVPEFDSPVFKPGEKYDSTTVYEFSVQK